MQRTAARAMQTAARMPVHSGMARTELMRQTLSLQAQEVAGCGIRIRVRMAASALSMMAALLSRSTGSATTNSNMERLR